MKRLFLFGLLVIGLSGCTKDNSSCIQTGAQGTVVYGTGDCMPIIDESKRTYTLYVGWLYFILKADLDKLGNGSLQDLKNRSAKIYTSNGNFTTSLAPNTYVVLPEKVYESSAENTITITNGQLLQTSLKFWECTSY